MRKKITINIRIKFLSFAQVLVIGAGVTLYEGLKAADIMGCEGVGVRVLDPFTIKPIDAKLIIDNAKQCGGRIITVEDHYPEGGAIGRCCWQVPML